MKKLKKRVSSVSHVMFFGKTMIIWMFPCDVPLLKQPKQIEFKQQATSQFRNSDSDQSWNDIWNLISLIKMIVSSASQMVW